MSDHYKRFEKYLNDAIGFLYRELRKEFPKEKTASIIKRTVEKMLKELEKEN